MLGWGTWFKPGATVVSSPVSWYCIHRAYSSGTWVAIGLMLWIFFLDCELNPGSTDIALHTSLYVEMSFCKIAWPWLPPRDPPVAVSWVAGITGIWHHHTLLHRCCGHLWIEWIQVFAFTRWFLWIQMNFASILEHL